MALQILPAVDRWRGDDGSEHEAAFLMAQDREGVPGHRVLAGYLGEPPAGHHYAYRHVDATTGAYWRTYVLDGVSRLDGRAVTDAKLTFDDAGHALVQISLTPAGQRAFEALAREQVGRQVAILLDGKVKAAFVLHAMKPGAPLAIAMAPGDDKQQAIEAYDLVAVLEAGAMPELRLEQQRLFDRLGFWSAWPFFAAVGSLLLAALVLARRTRAHLLGQ
jgi:hypothetical protein